jgi:DNA-binding transcriptional LysR family regulator
VSTKPPLDLNLLVVLDALLTHRHVSRAAEALGVGQPAVSAALKRLRRHYSDVLLERLGNAYALTPFATELAPRVAHALSEARRVTDADLAFDAATSDREFDLVLSDAAAAILLPSLLARLRTEAPGVKLSATQHAPTEDLDAALRRHDGIVLPHELTGVMPALPLFEDRWVCVVESRPGLEELTLDELRHRSWVLVRPSGLAQPVGLPQLLSLGVVPTVALVLDHFSSVPSTLIATESVAVVPERLAAVHPGFVGLHAFPCPWPTPPFRLALHWHPTLERDGGHQWFRRLVAEVAASL